MLPSWTSVAVAEHVISVPVTMLVDGVMNAGVKWCWGLLEGATGQFLGPVGGPRSDVAVDRGVDVSLTDDVHSGGIPGQEVWC